MDSQNWQKVERPERLFRKKIMKMVADEKSILQWPKNIRFKLSGVEMEQKQQVLQLSVSFNILETFWVI